MNKWIKGAAAVGLCAALCLGSAGAALAQAASGQTQTEPEQTVKTQTASPAQQAASKDETVYVLAGADGSVQKIIVSDWIRNTQGSAVISDRSELQNIENVKGEESYTLNGDGMMVWDAQGNDIYYQGDIDRELPVGLSVSYKLDGKAVSAREIAGKSGRVTIRFDYENRQYETVQIDGKQETVCVPFAMLTGVVLDGEIFRNVEVSNGKLICDGDRTIVAGLAFPGLQESLALNRDQIELPDYVEITADAESFELGMTVTVAASGIFNELLDGEKLDAVTRAADSLDELTDAMTRLTDGSSALYDGLCTLLERSDELIAGMDQLADGAKTIRDGADSLDEGTAQLQAGLAELSSGLETLSANSAALNSGAAQVFDSLLATADTQLRAAGIDCPTLTRDNYAQVLDGILASMDPAALSDQARQQVAAQVVKAAAGMSLSDYEAAAAAGSIPTEQQTAIEAAIDQQMTSDAVQAQLAAAAEGAQTILALKASLDSYNTFWQGLCTYTAGVDSAASGAAGLSAGASALKEGTAKLRAGAAVLYDGVLTMKNGAPALTDGVTQLRDGSMELSDGLKQLNEQGIRKLSDLVGGEAREFAARLRAVAEASERCTSFAGISDDMDGQVKFVYRTDEIGSGE